MQYVKYVKEKKNKKKSKNIELWCYIYNLIQIFLYKYKGGVDMKY